LADEPRDSNTGATGKIAPSPCPRDRRAQDEDDTDVNILAPEDIRFVKDRNGRLGLVFKNESCFLDIKPVRAFPLSSPDSHVELQDVRGKRIGLLVGMEGLSTADRQLLEEALNRRYFAPRILKVLRIRESYGLHIFDVETDRGPCSFTIRSLNSDIRSLSPTRYRFTDPFGICYDMDMAAMDEKSRRLLEDIL